VEVRGPVLTAKVINIEILVFATSEKPSREEQPTSGLPLIAVRRIQMPDDGSRRPGNNDVTGKILRHNCTSTHDYTITNRRAGTKDCGSSDPAVVAYRYLTGIFEERGTELVVQRMPRCIHLTTFESGKKNKKTLAKRKVIWQM